jgi:hypothetical protein
MQGKDAEAEQMLRELLGLIGAHEQETHPERNKVLNCLGSPYEPTVEITSRARMQPEQSSARTTSSSSSA